MEKKIVGIMLMCMVMPVVSAQVWVGQFDQVTLLDEESSIALQLGGFHQPTSIVGTRNKMLWIAEREDSEVYQYSAHGELLNTFHRQSYRKPQALAVGEDDGVWVAYAKQVVKLDVEAKEKVSVSGFVLPQDLLVTNKGHVWVADTGNRRLVKLREDGTTLIEVNQPLKKISYDPKRDVVWGLDEFDEAVYAFSSDGTQLMKISGFFAPDDVSVCENDGSVWMSNTNHNEVIHLNSNGKELHRLTGFRLPTEVDTFVNEFYQCLVWVVDKHNGQLVLLGPKGEERERLDHYNNVFALSTPYQDIGEAPVTTAPVEKSLPGEKVVVSTEGTVKEPREGQEEVGKVVEPVEKKVVEKEVFPEEAMDALKEETVTRPEQAQESDARFKALFVYVTVMVLFGIFVGVLFWRKLRNTP